eukprot:1690910-Rhodomonas_salina.2
MISLSGSAPVIPKASERDRDSGLQAGYWTEYYTSCQLQSRCQWRQRMPPSRAYGFSYQTTQLHEPGADAGFLKQATPSSGLRPPNLVPLPKLPPPPCLPTEHESLARSGARIHTPL